MVGKHMVLELSIKKLFITWNTKTFIKKLSVILYANLPQTYSYDGYTFTTNEGDCASVGGSCGNGSCKSGYPDKKIIGLQRWKWECN